MKTKMIVIALAALFALSLVAPVFADTGYNLIAGQTIDVGDIYVSNDNTNIFISIAMDPNWEITQGHVAVATNLEGIPQTKSGNPKVGQFPYKGLLQYTIPLPNGADAGDKIIIAVHAVVQGTQGGLYCGQEETAWGRYCDAGGGTSGDFEGNNWATYLIYTVT